MLFWRDDGALGGGNDRDRVFCTEGFLDFLNRSGFAEGEACRVGGAEENIHIRQNRFDARTRRLAAPEVCAVIHIKRDERAVFFKFFDALDRKFLCVSPNSKVMPLVWNRRVL